MAKFLTCVIIFYICNAVYGNTARQSYKDISEVLEIVTRIEEKLSKEDRLREIMDIVRMDSTLDKVNKKLDRILNSIDSRAISGRSNSLTPAPEESEDIDNRLRHIDDKLGKLEATMYKVEVGFDRADLKKLEDIDRRSSELSDDLDKKLRKMMNVITALYEMNKEIKTNIGGRSGAQDTTPQVGNNYAAEFLIENLDDLEKKIKEQFSVLANEIRTEITGLKIMASSMSEGCSTLDTYDYAIETPQQPTTNTRSKSGSSRRKQSTDTAALENLAQSLSRSTREIRGEIHQSMQAIDNKLSNLSYHCGDLQAYASIPSTARSSRGFNTDVAPDQSVSEKSDRKTAKCSRVSSSISTPKSCSDLRKGGATCDGVYVIFPMDVRAVRVFCDMTTEDGGWTVLMRRGDFGDKRTNFHRNWLSYKNGFGDVEGEFWLGNDVFHYLTTQDENILKVRLESFDDEDVNLTYSSFSVSNEEDSYRVHIGPAKGPSTPASNSLKYHNNHPFSTFDKKNDNFQQNCAATYKGGWWFNGCYFGFLTGEYFAPGDKRENWEGMLWYDWKGNSPLKSAVMMIRPKNFTLN